MNSIAIIGAGSIGSNLALLLARMGVPHIAVYDFDTVEAHNLGHQAYRVCDLGKPKTEALKEIIKSAADIDITVHGKTDGADINTDILILAVDSMAARKEISEKANYIFCIDGRMGGETFNIFSFAKVEYERYAATLYSDESAVEAPCGGKAIAYTAYLIAALIANTTKKIMTADACPFEQNFCAKNLIYSTTL